jgi:Domain of unknown function (DUF5655)
MRHQMSSPPAQPRSWQEMDAWVRDMLVKRTGEDVAAWNAKIAALDPADETALRAWLTEQGVTGYPQMLLVMERFGYPDYLRATADELLDGQYADRPALRPIHDALLALLPGIGTVEVQNRKTYVALITPRRTFASIEPRTKSRVDLGMRLSKGQPANGRLSLATSMGQSGVTHRIGLASVEDVDDEVRGWLQRAYDANV